MTTSPSKPRVLTPLEEKALMWRHVQVVRYLHRLDQRERELALLAVVAPGEDLLRLSMDAVAAGEISADEAEAQLELFAVVPA
jgi:hypothetical protein